MTGPNFTSPYTDEGNSISVDALLYRRIFQGFIDWDSPDPNGRPRLTSAAFQDYKLEDAQRLGLPAPAMSVGLGPILDARGLSPEKILEPFDDTYGLAVLTAGDVRSLEQGVMAKPTEEEPWHAVVFSMNEPKRSKRIRAVLAEKARWVHVPRRAG
jgi:hypothetical protein